MTTIKLSEHVTLIINDDGSSRLVDPPLYMPLTREETEALWSALDDYYLESLGPDITAEEQAAVLARLKRAIDKTPQVTNDAYPDWPRTAGGFLICSIERPMPQGAEGKWWHPDNEEIGPQTDGWPAGDWTTMKCQACGHTWEMELPQ